MPATARTSIPPRSAARWRCKRRDAAASALRADADRYHQRGLGDLRGQPGAGSVTFDVHAGDGVTRRRDLHESGSLRVRFPSPEASGLSGVFVNTAGGIAGGDRFDIDIAVGEGSRLAVTTAAAEKIYRAHGAGRAGQYRPEGRAPARISPGCRRKPSCSTGARVVAADRYRSGRRRLAAALRNRGVRPRRDGRDACCSGEFVDRWRHAPRRQAGVRRNRAARRRHRRKLAQPAVANGGVAIGTALIVPGDEALVERIREASRIRSAARSASPPGMDLQWRASVPKMRHGCAPT